MRLFKKILCIALISFFVGCNSSQNEKVEQHNEGKICPQCNMPLGNDNTYTSIIKDGKITYFDDMGCMILYAKENNIDLNNIENKVFTTDTKRYVNSSKVLFKIDEKTPMSYGFSAYEKECENCIKFDEVVIRMLRGEHMANPKIRKQILGY